MTLKAFTWINMMIGNVNNSMHASYNTIRVRYLEEFCYRFYRRFVLEDMIPRISYAALRTPPMPQRMLSMAEAWG